MELAEPFSTDGYGTVTIGEWGGWVVQVMPMLYNDRLILTPAHFRSVIDYGWCYDKGAAAYAAARVWDPATEGEPPGYKKAAAGGRRPGQTAAETDNGLEALAVLSAVLGADFIRDVIREP